MMKTTTVELQNSERVAVRVAPVTNDLIGRINHIVAHKDDPATVEEELIDVISELIVDDLEHDSSNDGMTYTDREVWEGFAEEYGAKHLADVFVQVATPLLDEAKTL